MNTTNPLEAITFTCVDCKTTTPPIQIFSLAGSTVYLFICACSNVHLILQAGEILNETPPEEQSNPSFAILRLSPKRSKIIVPRTALPKTDLKS